MASRQAYAHRAYYSDLLAQRQPQDKQTTLELDFLEHILREQTPRRVKEVLDLACGGGRHVVGLAERGFRCTGQDFTPERIDMAKARAKRSGVSVRLHQGDATKLPYTEEFDAVLALYILFLLPNDSDVEKCLLQAHRSLRPGGLLVCNVYNPFSKDRVWFSELIHKGLFVSESHARGIRITSTERLKDFDPIHGIGWDEETTMIESPDGLHVFRDRERFRLLTFWDIRHYLEAAGFHEIKCYPDWRTKSPKRPKAQQLVFVARK